MEHLSLSRPSADNSISRRALFLLPFGALIGIAAYLLRGKPLLNPSQAGLGVPVTIVLFDDSGRRLQTVLTRKLVKTPDEWRRQLGAESFAITRQQATEFAFHNLYWDNDKPGIYRCLSCGNALFSSQNKFDSGTGWPSFSAPIADQNIFAKPDRSLAFQRTETLCTKCDAHLGHVFDDGPAPTYKRYCMNSAALHFIDIPPAGDKISHSFHN